MKRDITIFLSLWVLVFTGCSANDQDSNLDKVVETLEQHIQALRDRIDALNNDVNSSISSLSSILAAYESNDYVTAVAPIIEDGQEIGYLISFAKSGDVRILNGRNGQEGTTFTLPEIGVKKDTDGNWYWTLDGNWLLDDDGNRVIANGTDDNDEQNGQEDRIPKLKIEDGYWFISYDNGIEWTRLGKATGEDGQDGADAVNPDNVFSDIVVLDGAIQFFLKDGTVFSFVLGQELEISFDIGNNNAIAAGQTRDINYQIQGADINTTVECLADNGWTAVVHRRSNSAGVIEITAPRPIRDGKVLVFVSTGDGRTYMKTLRLYKGTLSVAKQRYSVSFAGGDVPVDITANVEYTIDVGGIPGWLSLVPDTRAESHTECLVFRAEENMYTGNRIAEINLVDSKHRVIRSFEIEQAGNPEGIISFDDNTVKAICVQEFDTDADGELTVAEARAVESIGTLFKYTDITSFDELQYFTGLTAIPDEAFNYCRSLRTIILPPYITSIGASAFRYNNSLSAIDIPASVIIIGKSAFSNCEKLLDVLFSGTELQSIGDYAFEYCSSLDVIHIPYTVEHIGNCAFRCSALTSVSIPPYITEISDNCFESCRNLKYVGMPQEVISIGKYAFYRSGITEIHLPETVTAIGQSAFSFSGLCVFECCGPIQTIQQDTFAGCENLEVVILPESINRIGETAFSGCKSLSEIIIPEQVTKIDDRAFYGTAIKSIVLPVGITSISEHLFGGCSNLETVVFKGSVSQIGRSAFDGCIRLGYLDLRNATSLGDYAFSGCSSLAGIELSDNLTSIPAYCFYKCSSISSLKMPSRLESLGQSAFSECSGLTRISLPGKVKRIPSALFYKCTSLKEIEMTEAIEEIDSQAFEGCVSLMSFQVPELVITIPSSMLRGCSSLNTIIMHDGITKIESYAFGYCTSLKDVYLPKNISELAYGLFEGCIKLESISIQEKITKIGSSVFKRCQSLKHVTILAPQPPTIYNDCFTDASPELHIVVPQAAVDAYKAASGWNQYASVISSSMN